MTFKFAVLMVAAVVLSACGTTSSDDAGPTGHGKRLVVRGAVVPDEPETSVKPKKARIIKKASTFAVADASSSAPVEAPVAPEKPAAHDKTTAPMVASTSGGNSGGGTDGGGTPVVSEPSTIVADGSTTPTAPSPSDVTTTPLAPVEPSTVTAEPVGGAPAPTPSPLAIDFRDMLNTTIAGFPLWLMVVVGILLAAALVFGTGGGRRERTPERDYRDDREPDYDDRTYADGRGDAEPEPA